MMTFLKNQGNHVLVYGRRTSSAVRHRGNMPFSACPRCPSPGAFGPSKFKAISSLHHLPFLFVFVSDEEGGEGGGWVP